ncbi:phage major tail tube protein [Geoalkalibacter halelectricus]|uniref:phage major tail tube protein n=1 Tax=Geoalkalibacter halelectricus TaxID=2847045 RepID=UPI003D250E88
MALPSILKNFNLFVDGRGYAGKVDEVELPKLTIKTEEYRAGGMDAPVDIDMGMGKLECSFTLSEYDPALFAMWGLVPGNWVNITLRGAMDKDGTVTPVIVNLTGRWKEIDMGNWKAGEVAKLKVQVSGRYYGLVIGGAPVVLIDIENMVRIVGGVDQLKATRAAMGV